MGAAWQTLSRLECSHLYLFIKPLWTEDWRFILIKIKHIVFSYWDFKVIEMTRICYALLQSLCLDSQLVTSDVISILCFSLCELLWMDGVHCSVRKSEDICLPQQVDVRLQDVFLCWSLCHSVSFMKIEDYVKGCDKAALTLHCISSFSLDPDLALVRNTCLISQLFSCREPAMLTETNELVGRGRQKSASVPDVRDVKKQNIELPFCRFLNVELLYFTVLLLPILPVYLQLWVRIAWLKVQFISKDGRNFM